MTSFSGVRLLTMGLGVALAWACTVADKSEYDFDDTPGEGGDGGTSGGSGGASGGKGGRGGGAGTSTGGKGGSSGTGGSGAEGGVGAEGGEAGESSAGAGTGGSSGGKSGNGGTAGTGGEDPCDPNPCVHGDCSVDGSDYDCSCDNGWEGSRCQTNIDDCDPNPCENGGTCADHTDDFTCTCTPGYSGDTCDIVPVDCDPDPCVNGTCMELAGGISCVCDAGWDGENCTTNVDECAPTPCENGGTCRDQVNGFACDCSGTGYTGTTCSMDDDECTSNPPCQHGGICTNSTGSYSCNCTGTGYTGTDCQTDVNECTSSSPCQHGGTCTNSTGGYSCNCTGTGYTGTNCETNVNECSANPCNMGTCTDGVNSYTCSCPAGTLGSNCERYCGNGTRDGASVQSITLTFAAIHCNTTLTELPLFLNGVPIHGLGLGGCDCNAATPQTLVVTDPAVLAAVRPTGNIFEVRVPSSLVVYTGYVRATFGLNGASDVDVMGIDGTSSTTCAGSPYPTPITQGSLTGATFGVLATEACDGASGCSACGCPNGQILCSNRCTDIVTSETSCGSCSTTCSSGQACAAGVCRSPITINIPASGLVSMVPYSGCSDTEYESEAADATYGLTWVDPGGFTPSSVTVELGANWDCVGAGSHVTTLNGVASGSFTLTSPGCICAPTVIVNSWALTNISSYVPGGANTLMITHALAGERMSLDQDSSWPAGTYARVILNP